jgi:hypothetical protein
MAKPPAGQPLNDQRRYTPPQCDVLRQYGSNRHTSGPDADEALITDANGLQQLPAGNIQCRSRWQTLIVQTILNETTPTDNLWSLPRPKCCKHKGLRPDEMTNVKLDPAHQ